MYCPNGVDYEHFQLPEASAPLPPPPDLAEIVALHTPVIGYYGALARWFDYDLLKKLTVLRPNYSFVLIGPDYDGTLKPAAIDAYKSIHWLGVKPYNDLPGYLKYFDVTMIPFQLNDITHATSPLKLFEYMAGGKPTVVTPMRESMGYEGVLVGKDAEDFASRLDDALILVHDPEFLQLLERVARANTWDARARQILAELEKRGSPSLQPAA